jgi:hypothetical protein
MIPEKADTKLVDHKTLWGLHHTLTSGRFLSNNNKLLFGFLDRLADSLIGDLLCDPPAFRLVGFRGRPRCKLGEVAAAAAATAVWLCHVSVTHDRRKLEVRGQHI